MRYVLPKTLTSFVVAFSLVSAVFTSPGAARTSEPPARAAARQTGGGGGSGPGGRARVADKTPVDADTRRLSDDGPQFPRTFSPSDFTVKAFVKGGWPVFIAYELEQPGVVTLQINFVSPRFVHCPPYFHTFGGRRVGRYEEMFPLPGKFANEPQPLASVYTIKAMSDLTPQAHRVPFHLRAFGAGPKAVGSSGFDWVKFEPGQVVARQRERASYSFHAIRYFPKATADFVRIQRGPDGEIVAHLVGRNEHDQVRTDVVVSGYWDCRKDGRASVGLHELYVRGWRTLGEGGDWMVTSSVPQRVLVQ
jgi:hypothetical protein